MYMAEWCISARLFALGFSKDGGSGVNLAFGPEVTRLLFKVTVIWLDSRPTDWTYKAVVPSLENLYGSTQFDTLRHFY